MAIVSNNEKMMQEVSDLKARQEATETIEQPLVIDENDMASDSDLGVPTQQSVKAYADSIGTAANSYADGVASTAESNANDYTDTEISGLSIPTDHDELAGLDDDDHTQYVLAELSSTDNRLVRWDSTSGRAIQTSAITVDDSGNASGVNVLTANDYIYTTGLRVSGTGDPGTDAKIANNIAVGGTATIFTSGANANNWDCEYNSITGSLIFISSDKRHKEDFDYTIDGLEIVGKLKPVAFKFKKGQKREFGFIAQEAIEAHDYLAWHDKESDKWGISGWRGYAAVLVKAVQELTQRVKALEKELNK